MSLAIKSIRPSWRKRVSACAALIFIALAAPALAGDHLSPEDSILGQAAFEYRYADEDARLDYYYANLVVNVFKDAFAPDVVLRAIRENPLVAESVVGVEQGKDGFRIFALESDVLLFRYAEIASEKHGHVDKNGKRAVDERAVAEFQADVPADPKDVKLTRCEAPIESALAGRVAKIWDVMLRGTRYDSPTEVAAQDSVRTVIVDGTTYHFSAQRMSGQVYATDAESDTGHLVRIADAMADYCKDGNDASLRSLTQSVGQLERRLQSKK
jgi:hypothetical protein